MINVAFVGCGYVADFYAITLENHMGLRLAGVYDRNQSRAKKFSTFHAVKRYQSLSDLLSDSSISIVVNLTSPHSHYEISKKALEAGKHVYSEKPLALNYEDAKELVELAENRHLVITAAPCSLLSETAQCLYKAIRDGEIGKPRIIYAELDDGAIHTMNYRSWRSPSGVAWPFLDEFAVGSTFEHAGYLLSWLTALFGPVVKLSALSKTIVDKKCPELSEDKHGTDFSLATLVFANDVVARFTCGIVAPFDHKLQIVGEEGVLQVDECWDYEAPVYIRRQKKPTLRSKWETHYYLSDKQVYKPIWDPTFIRAYNDTHNMDFARGVKELADSVLEGRECRLSPRHALHITEVVSAINSARNEPDFFVYEPQSRFEASEPMPWATSTMTNTQFRKVVSLMWHSGLLK